MHSIQRGENRLGKQVITKTWEIKPYVALRFNDGTQVPQGVVSEAQRTRYYLTSHGGNLEYSLSSTVSQTNSQFFRFVDVGGWNQLISHMNSAAFDACGGDHHPYFTTNTDRGNGNLIYRFEEVQGRDGKMGYFIRPYVKENVVLDSNTPMARSTSTLSRTQPMQITYGIWIGPAKFSDCTSSSRRKRISP